MQKYINMNDSFGGKNSVSSTKTFRSEVSKCIQNLSQQLKVHKKALFMAEQLVEQYKEQNERLRMEIQELKRQNIQSEQKFETLQNFYIKLDQSKQKQYDNQNRQKSENFQYQIQKLEEKYFKKIQKLQKRILILESSIKQQRQSREIKNNDDLKNKRDIKEIQIDSIMINVPMSKNCKQLISNQKNLSQKRNKNLLLKIYLEGKQKKQRKSDSNKKVTYQSNYDYYNIIRNQDNRPETFQTSYEFLNALQLSQKKDNINTPSHKYSRFSTNITDPDKRYESLSQRYKVSSCQKQYKNQFELNSVEKRSQMNGKYHFQTPCNKLRSLY